MSETEYGILNGIQNLLQQDYHGVNIAVYGFASAGLAISIHRIRPISKFSTASKIPNHFLKNHEPLKGIYIGVKHSPVRVLIDHKPPIYLPLWHSSKPSLPVKLWGVNIVSGNAVNWLECVARGKQVTLQPIHRDGEDLVSTVLLHLPQQKSKKVEILDIGQKLVELGFAQAAIPKIIKKGTFESKLASTILSAEAQAKNYRNGVWSENLPPLPLYIIYWRKGSRRAFELVLVTTNKVLKFSAIALKIALQQLKNLVLRPFKVVPKKVMTT